MRKLHAYVANESTLWVHAQLLLFFYCSTFLSPRPCFFSLAYLFFGVIFGLIWRKKPSFLAFFFSPLEAAFVFTNPSSQPFYVTTFIVPVRNKY